ncbi:MAG: hypothetical protein E7450_07950 [Ruminococcaceae bacterium]|nr:hypothetical protein [Oscillospiraceae bacterium]
MKRYEYRRIISFLLAVVAAVTLGIVLGGCGKDVPPVSPSQSVAGSVSGSGPVTSTPPPAQQSGTSTPSVSSSGPTLLTPEQARAIALNHAGLTAGQVTGLRSELDVDDGVREYEVEFRFDGWEYDYEIHAVSGAVLSSEKDRD